MLQSPKQMSHVERLCSNKCDVTLTPNVDFGHLLVGSATRCMRFGIHNGGSIERVLVSVKFLNAMTSQFSFQLNNTEDGVCAETECSIPIGVGKQIAFDVYCQPR